MFISPALLQVYLRSSSSSPSPTPAALPSPAALPPSSSPYPYPPPAPFPPPSSSSSGSVGASTYASVLQTLALTVIVPLVVGQLILAFADKYVKLLQKYVNFGKVRAARGGAAGAQQGAARGCM